MTRDLPTEQPDDHGKLLFETDQRSQPSVQDMLNSMKNQDLESFLQDFNNSEIMSLDIVFKNWKTCEPVSVPA